MKKLLGNRVYFILALIFLIDIIAAPIVIHAGNSFGGIFLIIVSIVIAVLCWGVCLPALLPLIGIATGTLLFTVVSAVVLTVSILGTANSIVQVALGAERCGGHYDYIFGTCTRKKASQEIYTPRNVRFTGLNLAQIPSPEEYAADHNRSGETTINWHADAPEGAHEWLEVLDGDTGQLVYSNYGNGVSCREETKADKVSLRYQHSYIAVVKYDSCVAIKGGKLTRRVEVFCSDSGAGCGDLSYRGIENTSGILAKLDFGTLEYPTPKVDIKANGQDGNVVFAPGTPVTISWTSEYADYCTASDSWSGTKGTSGSETVIPANDRAVYSIECTRSGQNTRASVSGRDSVSSALPDRALQAFGSISSGLTIRDFNATNVFNPGDRATLSWSVDGATGCEVNNGIGAVAPVGTVTILFSRPITFRLTCHDDEGHTVAAEKDVDVRNIPGYREVAP